MRLLIAELLRLVEERLLNVIQQLLELIGDVVQRERRLFAQVAAEHGHNAVFQVARTHLEANRNALHFPVVELVAGGHGIAVVKLRADACRLQLLIQLLARLHDAGLMRRNRQDDRLNRRDTRRQAQTAFIAVRHDDGANQARRRAPARFLRIGQLSFLILELDAVRLGEIRAEVVARAGLQRLAVLHHGFHGVRCTRAGELFLIRLLTDIHRQRHHVFRNLLIDVQHLHRLFLRLFGRCVDGVPLLPEEFARAQERTRRLLPAHDRAPLVVLHRQVAPRLHPLRVHGAEDGFGRRTNRQTLLQLFRAALRHPCNLRRKALDMLRFLQQQAFRNQHREIHVLMTRFLEALVHFLLDALPDGVAVRANDHAAAHRRVIAQLRLEDDVRIPLREVLIARCDVGYKFLLLFLRHGVIPPSLC